MVDKPIIFSGPMVRALLDGRKSMTRRLAWRMDLKAAAKIGSRENEESDGELCADLEICKPSPWQKVKPGDRLWVRESFAIMPRNCYGLPKTPSPDPDMAAYYMADFDRSGKPGWKPSIHMPRWASRLTLTVTATKIERLQDINDADAKAEGIVEDDGSEPDIWYVPGAAASGWKIDQADRPSKVFRSLWTSLHGAAAWDDNPDVVALSFTVAQENVDALKAAA